MSKIFSLVIPAKAATHLLKVWEMGPRLRGDDEIRVRDA